jgi:hypothetical protein
MVADTSRATLSLVSIEGPSIIAVVAPTAAEQRQNQKKKRRSDGRNSLRPNRGAQTIAQRKVID